MADIWNEVLSKATTIFREFIPRWEDRVQITWYNAPQAVLHALPYFFMAYLVRRPDTQLMRLLLLPTVIGMTLRCTYGYKFDDPRWFWYEWERGILGLFVIAKSTDFAFAKEGRLKVAEKALRQSSRRDGTLRHEGSDRAAELLGRSPAARLLPRSVFDALEVGLTMRGFGWDFGKYTPIPPRTLPLERRAYIRTLTKIVILRQLFGDLCDTLFKYIPGVTATGGSIFLPDLPPIQRYAVSTLIHLGVGLFILSSVAIVYDYGALFGVLFLHQSPSFWPPMQGSLLQVRSLHDYWNKAWHQSYRYTFLTTGGFLGQRLAGHLGMVFGCFLASGLMHEFALNVAGRPFDWRVVIFFLSQALGLVLENLFRKLTGKRVGGPLGLVWTVLFVLGIGQICTEAWFNRGMGGAIAIPPSISPVRRVLLPLVRRVIRSLSRVSSSG
ncbi:hypothetical protein BD413DRAFT_600538 [Trametes elegans]|nr:hypothetical protein BD413DRAFT_600538 [Trametes elegans]